MHVLVTGASGWIGSALVPELLSAGHRVTGLARSDASAAALTAAGADVLRGSLDDLDTLREGARAADGVVHLAFRHDMAFSGAMTEAALADRAVVDAFGEALAGTGKPLVIASGLLGVAPGRPATEEDGQVAEDAGSGCSTTGRRPRGPPSRWPGRECAASSSGCPPPCTAPATRPGVHLHPGRHRPRAGRLPLRGRRRRALAGGAPGRRRPPLPDRRGVGAGRVGAARRRRGGRGHPRHRGRPRRAARRPGGVRAGRRRPEVLGWLAPMLGLDSPASSARTRELTGWEPTGPTLLEDIRAGHYTR